MSQNLNYEFSEDDFKLAHDPMQKMYGQTSKKIKVL